MRCFKPGKPGGKPPSGEELLKSRITSGGDAPAVDNAMIERLLSALASIKNANNQRVRAVTDHMTIRQFRSLPPVYQLAFINKIWNANCTAHAFDQPGSQMFDPPGDGIDGNGPLPTSIRPVRIGMNVFEKRLRGRQPFREFGVGFRVDGADNSSVTRVTGAGMTQQRLSSAFMLGRRGLRLDATVMMDKNEGSRLDRKPRHIQRNGGLRQPEFLWRFRVPGARNQRALLSVGGKLRQLARLRYGELSTGVAGRQAVAARREGISVYSRGERSRIRSD
jgi:hypothetical protein